MFLTQGNWLYQLLMDYPQEKNVERWEVRTTSPGFAVWGFSVRWLLSSLGVTWGMTQRLCWHAILVEWLLALLWVGRKLGEWSVSLGEVWLGAWEAPE